MPVQHRSSTGNCPPHGSSACAAARQADKAFSEEALGFRRRWTRPLILGRRPLTALFFPTAALPLLVAYYQPHTTDRRRLAADCWPPTPGLCECWPLTMGAFGREMRGLGLAVHKVPLDTTLDVTQPMPRRIHAPPARASCHRAPHGARAGLAAHSGMLLLGCYHWHLCYWPLCYWPHTLGRIMLAAYYCPPTGRLAMDAQGWPRFIGRLLLPAHYCLPPPAARVLLATFYWSLLPVSRPPPAVV